MNRSMKDIFEPKYKPELNDISGAVARLVAEIRIAQITLDTLLERVGEGNLALVVEQHSDTCVSMTDVCDASRKLQDLFLIPQA